MTRLLPLVSLLFYSCGNNIPFLEVAQLKRPVGITLEAQSGLNYKLTYYVQNQEEVFDGYNIYVSRSTIPDSTNVSGSPLVIDGTVPTIKLSPADFDLQNSKSITMTTYDGFRAFESGVTYFFRISAHSRTGGVSELSNEVSAESIN